MSGSRQCNARPVEACHRKRPARCPGILPRSNLGAGLRSRTWIPAFAGMTAVSAKPSPYPVAPANAGTHFDFRTMRVATRDPTCGRGVASARRQAGHRIDRLAVVAGETMPRAVRRTAASSNARRAAPGRGSARKETDRLSAPAGRSSDRPVCRCSGSRSAACRAPHRCGRVRRSAGRPARARLR